MKLAIRIVLFCLTMTSTGLAQLQPPRPPAAVGNLIRTVAGTGTSGFSGDGGQATSAAISFPEGIAVDGAGVLYFADSSNYRVRKVTPGGVISTIAGTGTSGFSGDGGPATSAQISSPTGIAVDGAGVLYFADTRNNRVRKVTARGVISTVAGNGTLGFSGDGGPATSAQLNMPLAVAVDAAGILYVSDRGNQRVRKVTPNGVISTVAGNGTTGFSGDGGPATSAQLDIPFGLAVDADGVLYFADVNNRRVRKVAPSGVISTIAGNGLGLFNGDGIPATSAYISPRGIAVDATGNIYISDFNNRIRMITRGNVITTVAGNGTRGFSGDGGLATSAQITDAEAVAVDAAGVLYIADLNNSRVRKVGSRSTRDFNGDGKTDVLWRDAAGNVSMWLMNGTTITYDAFIASVSPVWRVVGSGDFDANGTADILWRDTAGNVSIWLMDGTTITSYSYTATVALAWAIAGVADFNGDGKADILWRDDSGNVAIWLMNGNSIVNAALIPKVTGGTIVGTGDLDGDGKSDILWREPTGSVTIALMDGFTITSYSTTRIVPAATTIEAIADFNGDGKVDILWRGPTGNVAVWLMNGHVIANDLFIAAVSPVWAITGSGDFNVDGKADILWQSTAGSASIWFMDGNIITSHPDLGSVAGRMAQ